jgi:L-iditol 2-dehydrogenase/threonine 3-dehydrogenase
VLRVEGFQAPGCAQDLFVTTEDKIVPLPDSLTFEQGALVEPTAVGVHSTGRAPELKGKNVVVLGAGAKKILITDLSDFRLEMANKCGIENTSNAGKESLADAAKRVFGDEGFDVAFEAAGAEATMDAAIQSIEKGGAIVVLGVFGDKPQIDMSIVGDREQSIIGTLMYKHHRDADVQARGLC